MQVQVQVCAECGGTGNCAACNGKGYVPCLLCYKGRACECGCKCRYCGGTGRKPCPECWGTGLCPECMADEIRELREEEVARW